MLIENQVHLIHSFDAMIKSMAYPSPNLTQDNEASPIIFSTSQRDKYSSVRGNRGCHVDMDQCCC